MFDEFVYFYVYFGLGLRPSCLKTLVVWAEILSLATGARIIFVSGVWFMKIYWNAFGNKIFER